MLRKACVVTCLFASAAVLAIAAERATFILTNGERVSGTVVFHTDERTNFRPDTNELSLGKTEGGEVAVKVDQIAVIDFVAGAPSNAELAALPDSGHAVVMRNGETKRGTFRELINGDTVRWRDERGDLQHTPITQVRRVYLKTDSARTIFNYRPRPGSRPGTGGDPSAAGGSTPSPLPSGPGYAVRANVPWSPTGITVQNGQRVRFEATGQVTFGPGANQRTGPQGRDNQRGGNLPVPNEPTGALIGKVGENGRPFLIGASTEPFVLQGNGRLYLGVNDAELGDNSGGFSVLVTKGR